MVRWDFVVRALISLAFPFVAGTLMGCQTSDDTSSSTTPTIVQVVPSQGVVGTAIAVRGTNFGSSTGELALQDPNTSRFVLATVSGWSDDVIVASVPTMDSATGVLKVGLKTSSGNIPASAGTFTLTSN